MSDSLPAEIIVTELPDGVRYRLPRRKPRGIAVEAVTLLMGAVLGIGFMAFWLWAVGYHVPWHDPFRGPDGMLLLFLGFGVWMLGMILWGLGQRATRFIGHSEIELRGGTLRAFECWGPLRWGWRRSVSGLQR